MTNIKRVSDKELKAAIKRVKSFFDELKKGFTARDHQIDLYMLSLLGRQHIMFFGPPGTSKTLLIDTIFSNIENMQSFSLEMTAFMGEDAIFGPYDIKKIREQGKLHHNVEGMLPEADLARLGEVLDANSATLRSTLGAINERRFVRGAQNMDMPLHTVYFDTNEKPFDYMKRNPQSWAFFDRIAFMSSIDYLSDAGDIAKMVHNYQEHVIQQPSVKLNFDDIRVISERIINPPSLWTNRFVLEFYAQAIVKYRELRSKKIDEGGYDGLILPEITDRRINIASHAPEVSAVLNDRTEVIVEDLYSAHYNLCTCDTEREIWKKIIDEKVEEYKQLQQNDIIRMQTENLQGYEDKLDKLIGDNSELVNLEESNINEIGITVGNIKKNLSEMVPENDDIKNRQQKLETRLNDFGTKVKDAWSAKHGL